jgi:hypothetical protein
MMSAWKLLLASLKVLGVHVLHKSADVGVVVDSNTIR